MHAVLLTIHAMVVVALIVVVLLQRSDGGALGLGGGGGGGFMTGRGAANALTRTTSILAAIFFATSIGLALEARVGAKQTNIIEDLTGEAPVDPNKPLTTDDLSNALGGATAPASTAPASTAPASMAPDSTVPASGGDTGAGATAPAESQDTAPAPAATAPAEQPADDTPQR